MRVLGDTGVGAVLVGDAAPLRRTLTLVVALPVLASVGFLLRFDAGVAVLLLFLAVALPLYGGWSGAGALAGAGAVFVAVLWRFVFPPLVGYARGTTAPRYAPPRMLGYDQSPRAELLEGLTNGFGYGIVLAVLLGSVLYLLGAGVRRLGNRLSASR